MEGQKRRQSSTCSEELFEFVDYTSVSNFERLSTAIEEILHSWDTKDGHFGIFSTSSLAAANEAIEQSSNSSSSEYYLRHEFLSIGDETYKLTYHCHPLAIERQKQQRPLVSDDFYLFDNNSLFRWTGFDRLFILTPVVDSFKQKLFSTGKAVGVQQAKVLISACAIAFQNVQCSVPVFVPVGLGRHSMYMGYLLQSGEGYGVRDLELRFNTAITYPISSQYTHLEGIRNLFLSKQEMFYEDCGALPPSEQGKENDIMVAGTFAYTLKNRYDDNWKDLAGWVKDESSLPFGSYNDPLRTLTLNAVFPLKHASAYQDDLMDTNMTLDTANQWLLAREFAPQSQQRAFLSTLLDQVITSWIRDPTNRDYLPPYDSSNEDVNRLERDNNGLVRNLFQAMGPSRRATASKIQANPQEDHINEIIESLFNGLQHSKKLTEGNVFTSEVLGYRIKRGAPVPYKSFFWNMLHYYLQSLPDSAKLSNNQTCIGFMHMLWIQVIRQIRWHWEHLKRIPNVDTSLYDQDDDKTEKMDSEYPDVYGIDLRFSILHQKLAMVNCCIQRRLDSGAETKNGNLQSTHIPSLFDDIVAVQRPEEQKDSTLDKFNSLLEKLVDGEEHDYEDTPPKSEKSMVIPDDPQESTLSDTCNQNFEDDDISDSDMFFDPLEDFDGFTDSKRLEPDSRKSSVTKVSTSSSLSDVSELARPHSMTESFVGLNYPSSAESFTRRSNNNFFDQYEVKDPNAFEGRKHEHPSLCLLNTNEPMWIPVMQDAGFMTEDMIRQQADIFEKLGTSESATHIRAKLQSAQLYSDMQAFKAANPHATLEDFVRWHSPRDWVKADDQEELSGRLSARMGDPGNIWQELWKCSTRTPASRQKPLFDVTAEGEKALHYLETVSIHEVFAMLLPTIALIAYDTLASHPIVSCTTTVAEGMSTLGETITNFAWDYLKNGKCTISPLISSIREQEATICNAISLLRKFPGQYDLVNRLLTAADTQVRPGEEQDAVMKVFKNERPSCREYVLHSNCPYAAADGRVLPLRLYAMVKDNELRVVDMESRDTLFQ